MKGGVVGSKQDGRYLYCIADAGEKVSLGAVGLEGRGVYTIPHQDLCAVVHDCPAGTYKFEDQDKLKDWVLAHQRVVDTAWERWGAVLPSALGVTIRGEAESGAGECVRRWMESDYHSLRERMAKVRGKAEYGVQVFWDPKMLGRALIEGHPEIKQLEEEVRSRPRGLAYMYRQRLEGLLRKEMEAQADRCFKECYGRVRRHVDDIRVERVKPPQAEVQMLLNLSCLVAQGKYADLGEDLDRIDRTAGLSVRFTGPWPPYSFVG